MLGKYLLKYRWLSFMLFLLCMLWALQLLPRIEISQQFDNYFPRHDPELLFYRSATAELGDEDDILMLAIRRERGILDSLFLHKVHELTLALDTFRHVRTSRSLTRLNRVRRTPFGVVQSPRLRIQQPESYARDSLSLATDQRLINRLISADLRTLTMVLELDEGLDGRQAEQLISRIEDRARSYHFDTLHILGRTYLEVCFNRMSRRELRNSFFLCIGLIILTLGFLYRSFWAVFIPLLIYLCAIALFLAVMVWRGHPLDAMSNLAPAILLIVSISDVIHFFSFFETKVREGNDQREALRLTINRIGLTLFLTSFTTAAGFLTLMISDLPTMEYLGADMATGVIIAYLVTMLLLPVFLHQLPARAFFLKAGRSDLWNRFSERLYRLVRLRSRGILTLSLLLGALGMLGSGMINTNNRLIDALPRHDSSAYSASFFADHLGGTRSFELLLLTKDSGAMADLPVLREIEKIDTFLSRFPMISGVFSPATYYKSLNEAWRGGNPAAYQLPSTADLLARQRRELEGHPDAFHRSVISADHSMGRISARMQDLGRQRIYDVNDGVRAWIDSEVDSNLLDIRILGASAMFDKIQEHAIRNMLIGLSIAIGVISLLILLLYRRLRLMLIVLLVNLLPLLLTGAVMALLGIELRYGTSVIFPIGFVIAVDDTIHFVGRYQFERLAGHSMPEALALTLRQTGRAMLLTSLILLLGFIQLIFSSFPDIRITGILVSAMLVFALSADLLLASALVWKWDKSSTLSSDPGEK